MTAPTLEWLFADTEEQLSLAMDALNQGSEVDLADLTPRIAEICQRVVESRATDSAMRLEGLMARLDALERILRELMVGFVAPGEPRLDGRRAAERYRDAAGLPDPTSEPAQGSQTPPGDKQGS